ncbi:hypothetical protein LINPERHAP1_LOCUS13938 [Linum perenne]
MIGDDWLFAYSKPRTEVLLEGLEDRHCCSCSYSSPQAQSGSSLSSKGVQKCFDSISNSLSFINQYPCNRLQSVR